jgi:hypothetical protein
MTILLAFVIALWIAAGIICAVILGFVMFSLYGLSTTRDRVIFVIAMFLCVALWPIAVIYLVKKKKTPKVSYGII